jgi:hypothetical protein
MANQIRIKRRSSSGSAGAPSSLKNGELAFNEADYNLYYGYGDDGSGNATSIPAISFGTLAAGDLIDISKVAGVSTIDVDLSELVDMTAAVDRTADELVLLDNGTQRRKLTSEIGLSVFDTDLTLADFTDDITTAYDISASSVTGGAGLVLTGTGGTNSGTDTVNFKGANGVTVSQTDVNNITITGTTYTAGTNGGLALAGTAFSIDVSNLPDLTTAAATTDEIILDDAGTAKRKALGEITLGLFDDDITTTYDLAATSVTGGSRLDVTGTGADATTTSVSIIGGTNVTVTHDSATQMTISSTNTTYSAGALLDLNGTTFDVDLSELTDLTTAMAGTDEFVILDASVQKRKAANEIPINIFNTAVATSITDVGTLVDLDVSGDSTFGGDVTLPTGDVIITSGVLQGPSTFYIDPAPFDSPQANNSPAATGTVVIRGDLQVDGTTTTVNSTVVEITDKTFNIASDASGSEIIGAGIVIGNGASDKTMLIGGGGDFTFNDGIVAVGASFTADVDLNNNDLLNAVIDGGTF